MITTDFCVFVTLHKFCVCLVLCCYWRVRRCDVSGILHKGDGTNIYLKQRPRRVTTVLGDGSARRVDCRGCNGRVDETRLMAPVSLASGRDGSLYIGDYNFIRKLASNRQQVASILQLRYVLSERHSSSTDLLICSLRRDARVVSSVYLGFWSTVCKTVRPAIGPLSCLSWLSVCLSVTLVYCGQTVGWIKMPLRTEIGLGPGDIVSRGIVTVPTHPVK